ncbi:hypothetical protein QTG54_000819 [Skeletonema marinoi]|uniref:Uncharacterized protein n=1 Tax=Skeletonema marinoi TaxID=267567 RepID=A0AAD8YPF6_9STRA|nr:hypothetical protein QTG54_000819 [Skeletonema marinoi]
MASAASTTTSTGAADALALLLQEDPLLLQHGLNLYSAGTVSSDASGDDNHEENTDDAAYAYAASLLHDDGSSASSNNGGWIWAQRVSRDSPAKVAGPLLRLHGFELSESSESPSQKSNNDVATLTATRDKADRLERQSQVLSTSARIECDSKMILRLQFEARKLGSGLDLDSISQGGVIDLRDLTRAAASVAVMEDLLSHPSLSPASQEGSIDKLQSPKTKGRFQSEGLTTTQKAIDAIYERLYIRKLREKRTAAASKWATEVSDASSRVWNLHRVLAARNDPVTRKNFLEVVAGSEVPKDFAGAEEALLQAQNENKDIENVTDTLNIIKVRWRQLESDVASLYPSVRSASLEMVTELHDVMQMGSASSDDATGLSSMGSGWNPTGVMGGSAGLEDSVFLGGAVGMDGSLDDPFGRADEAAGGGMGASADAWTHPIHLMMLH